MSNPFEEFRKYEEEAAQRVNALSPQQRQQVTQDENSLAKFLTGAIASGLTYDGAKKLAALMLSRGRARR